MSKHLGFGLALIVQLGILLGFPARTVQTLMVGQDVRLKLAPIDPFDMWSGYFVTLHYDVSVVDSTFLTQKVPDKSTVYVTLKKQANGIWEKSKLSIQKPAQGEVFLKGKLDGSVIKYGIEAYFMPEARRSEIEQDVNTKREKTTMVVAIDGDGNAALRYLDIDGKVFDF